MATYTYNPTGARPVKRKSPIEDVLSTPAAVPTPDMATPPLPTAVKPVVPEIAPAVVAPPPPVTPAPAITPAAAGPGPGTTTPKVETAPVDPNMYGKEDWSIDPIVGGGNKSVTYQKRKTDYVRPNPQYNTSMDWQLYVAPTDLDPITTARWNEINTQIEQFMSPENYANLPRLPVGDGNYVNWDGVKAMVAEMQKEQRNMITTTPTGTGAPPPATTTPGTTDTLPPSGTGGTPGQGATPTVPPTGETPTVPTPATPPPTTAKPVDLDSEVGTAQRRLDDFLKTDPTQHPGGMSGWIKERERLRQEVKTGTAPPQTEPTGGGKTTVTGDIEFDQPMNEGLKGFLDKVIADGDQLSPEEEATIRKNVDDAARPILSAMSARGLGRSSEVVQVIAQAEYEKIRQVGEAKARVRKEGKDAAFKAAEILQRHDELKLSSANAKANFEIAKAGQNLDALKNEQGVSFQDRAMALKEMETGAAIKLMEEEFNIKLDELEFKKFIETGELNAKVFDIVGTQRLNEMKIVNDYWLGKTDLDLQEKLGIDKIELQKWMAGEEFDIARGSQALERMFKEMDFDVSKAQIEAALRAAGSNDDAWQIALGILGIGAQVLL